MALIDSTENPAEGMEFDIVVNNAKWSFRIKILYFCRIIVEINKYK